MHNRVFARLPPQRGFEFPVDFFFEPREAVILVNAGCLYKGPARGDTPSAINFARCLGATLRTAADVGEAAKRVQSKAQSLGCRRHLLRRSGCAI